MKRLLKISCLLLCFMFIKNVDALTMEERKTKNDEFLNSYSFSFKHVDLSPYAKLVMENNGENGIQDESQVEHWFYNNLIRADLEGNIDLTSDDVIDVDCYKKGDSYTTFNMETHETVNVVASSDMCNIVIGYNAYSPAGYQSSKFNINGSFTEVDGDSKTKDNTYEIVKTLTKDVHITDVDMLNHLLNYPQTSSTFFNSTSAVREFAKLKTIVEENPELKFFVGYQDTRRGDYFKSLAEGSTFAEKDGIIYGATLNTYSSNMMFFVPAGTKKEDYASVLKQRLVNYINDSSIDIDVTDGIDNPDEEYDMAGNVSYSIKSALGMTASEYYDAVGTTFEKEYAKLGYVDEYTLDELKECITMYSYTLKLNGKEYGIGIAELDNANIAKFGSVTSKDIKTGIMIKSGASNVPLDVTLTADEYELSNDEIVFLNKLGYEHKDAFDLKLFSSVLNKIISKFNGDTEVLIPAENLGENVQVIYISDDLKDVEYFDSKLVEVNGKKYLSFKTKHFSNYILANKKNDVVKEEVKEETNPKTLDNIGLYSIIGVVSALGIVSMKFVIKKEC